MVRISSTSRTVPAPMAVGRAWVCRPVARLRASVTTSDATDDEVLASSDSGVRASGVRRLGSGAATHRWSQRSLPASPATLAVFLAAEADRESPRPATITRRAAAIAAAYRAQDHAQPVRLGRRRAGPHRDPPHGRDRDSPSRPARAAPARAAAPSDCNRHSLRDIRLPESARVRGRARPIEVRGSVGSTVSDRGDRPPRSQSSAPLPNNPDESLPSTRNSTCRSSVE